MGPHWRHNYDRSLTLTEIPDETPSEKPQILRHLTINRGNGTRLHFGATLGRFSHATAQTSYLNTGYTRCALISGVTSRRGASKGIDLDENNQRQGYTFALEDNSIEEYDPDGRLLSTTSPTGFTETLTYDNGLLAKVTGHFGHTLSFAYSGHLLTTVTDPSGDQYHYQYDSQNRLSKATYPDQSSETYVYEDARFPYALTGIIDDKNIRYTTWSYNADGQAISGEHANGAEKITLQYHPNLRRHQYRRLRCETNLHL